MSTYLDYNASAPIDLRVLDVMIEVYKGTIGNADSNICIPGVISEALMIMTKQYCSISNGSACTSKNYFPSYVLKAMGISEEEIECSVRISWGADTLENELKENLVKLIEIAKQIKG